MPIQRQGQDPETLKKFENIFEQHSALLRNKEISEYLDIGIDEGRMARVKEALSGHEGKFVQLVEAYKDKLFEGRGKKNHPTTSAAVAKSEHEFRATLIKSFGAENEHGLTPEKNMLIENALTIAKESVTGQLRLLQSQTGKQLKQEYDTLVDATRTGEQQRDEFLARGADKLPELTKKIEQASAALDNSFYKDLITKNIVDPTDPYPQGEIERYKLRSVVEQVKAAVKPELDAYRAAIKPTAEEAKGVQDTLAKIKDAEKDYKAKLSKVAKTIPDGEYSNEALLRGHKLVEERTKINNQLQFLMGADDSDAKDKRKTGALDGIAPEMKVALQQFQQSADAPSNTLSVPKLPGKTPYRDVG